MASDMATVRWRVTFSCGHSQETGVKPGPSGRCRTCHQLRDVSEAGHRWHRQQGGGWWCCVCENQCHKQHPCIDHAPCVPVPKATLCGGPHAN